MVFKVERLVVFELSGKFACFKKFYTNSSSFTSFVPSRTNLIGIVASILELPRDSYYDELNSKNCKIGVEILSDLKKKFECMNYFKKPNERDYTQVRLEVLSNKNIKNDKIKYRIYLWFKDNKDFTLDEFIDKIKNNDLGYGVYFGQRQFRADLKFVDVVEDIKLLENEINEISTVTNLKNIKDRKDIIFDDSQVYIEKMPFDFVFMGDNKEKNTNIINRELKSVREIVFNKNRNSILKVSSIFNKVLRISLNNKIKYITFYEDF